MTLLKLTTGPISDRIALLLLVCTLCIMAGIRFHESTIHLNWLSIKVPFILAFLASSSACKKKKRILLTGNLNLLCTENIIKLISLKYWWEVSICRILTVFHHEKGLDRLEFVKCFQESSLYRSIEGPT